MKASELMAGNIVFYEYDCQKFTAKVLEVYRNSVLVEEIHGDYEYIEIVENNIFPVEITPEILEKNGFVNKKGRFMQRGNFDDQPLIMWHLVDEEILRHPKSQLEIHHGAKSTHVSLVCIYVHELQHALRLCGLSELADNFKV